ncbi:MAG: ABC transporter permease [Clostridia bacterium]|nr:ABC transporter permease [Clostridia bacterium]
MKQFKTILKFELKSYFKNKTFIGITLFLVVAITLVMFFPRITALFDNDNDTAEQEKNGIMLIKPSTPESEELFCSAFSACFPDMEVKATFESDEQIKKAITENEAECAFVMTSLDSYTYYVNNLSIYDTRTATANEALTNIYQMSVMMSSGMSAEQAGQILSVQIESETVNLGKDHTENFFYTYIMIFALYMVILLYGQMVATSVATEKSSRAMELLITSARPTSMMFGKIFAACVAGLSQLVLVFGSAILFYKINEDYWGSNPLISSIFNMPVSLLVYMLIFFVLGFLIYAFLYGAIGSTASKLEDINTSVMPLSFMFIIAFMVVMTSMTSGDVSNMAIRICSYIPFTSPMAMFTRIAMSSVPIYEILISIAILAVSVVGIGIVSARIYRIGVVLYGTPPKPAAIIKALKNSK